MGDPVDTVLWHIEVSHHNEKVRWALDFKHVPHVRRAPLRGLQGLYALRRLLAARPRGAWVAETYARHRGTSAAVAAA
jgi:hypothetical protein